ncbi:restriction endonuclease subunit S [Paenibacillus anseongense]|uniref:restriction endonuclease subunit S n=1 Tax=Paenibacillus anseongense TaxID=2682845 RepID=UPI002DB68FE6|nr:restriction endonuclease subunit S [Paenibacillus anseongense]MEC0269368.1 restriction endonuclease subunit S [Paenibacillus anseongense]
MMIKTIEELPVELLIPKADQPYEVPENWVWTKLGHLVFVKTGKRDANHGTEDGQYPFFTCASEPINSPTFSFEGESILLPGNGANVGLVLYFDGKFEAYQRTYVLQPKCRVSLKYIYFQLLLGWKVYNDSRQYGSATNYIKLENITKYPIPLPPLLEQKRIVERVELLLAKLQEANRRVEDIPEIVRSIRKSIITNAFIGSSTENWRRNNPGYSSSILLDDLKGKTLGKTKNKIKQDLSFEPPTIPDSWNWAILFNISEIQGGITKGKMYNGETTIELPYLRVANVQDGFLELNEVKKIKCLQGDMHKYELKEGDLLFTEGGDRDKLGRCAVWNNEIKDCIHQNHIFRARILKGVFPEYIAYFTKTKFAKEYFFNNASQTVNLASINITVLGNLPIPIPPVEEQMQIIKIINSLYEKIEKIENIYMYTKEKIQNIEESILSRAFRGDFGTNDLKEKNALEILKQI